MRWALLTGGLLGLLVARSSADDLLLPQSAMPQLIVNSDFWDDELRRLPPATDSAQSIFLDDEVLPPPGEIFPDLAQPKADEQESVIETADDEPEAEEEIVSPWSGSLELGLDGSEGNTNTFNLQFGSQLKRETDFNTLKLQMRHNTENSGGIKTARSLLFDGRSEWPFRNNRWTYFIHSEGEYDEFKPFDLRMSGDSGFGYRFLNNDITKFTGRLGGSTSREIGGINDAFVPEMTFGLEFEREISSRQKLGISSEYYPDVTNFADYRLNTKAYWKYTLNPDWGMSLKLSAINRYDSTPSGALNSDTDYSALVLWDF